MKKHILFGFLLLVGIVCVNAQNLQKNGYNDGKVFAYIEQKKGTVTDYYGNGRMDTLRIENISGQEITVQYCFKAVKLDENNRYEQEKMVYQNKTIKAGDYIRENGRAAHNSKIGSYYVESFAIMNVQVSSNSTPKSNTNTQQSPVQPSQRAVVPSWAQGTWDSTDTPSNRNLIIITSSQLILGGDYIRNFTGVNGDILSFDGFRVIRTNILNQMQFSAQVRMPNGNVEWRYITYIKR